MTDFLFVYGTLMSGFGNNRFLSGSNSTLLGKATTKDKFLMDVSGPFPMLHEIPQWWTSDYADPVAIHGELYKVGDETLDFTDCIEGVPELYQRYVKPVVLLDTNETYPAWIYIFQMGQPNPFRHYDSDWRPHAAKRQRSNLKDYY